MSELKPCPFCGTNVIVTEKPFKPGYYKIVGYHDENCVFANMLWMEYAYPDKETLIEDWNRRVGT